jgi:short-subunit dehydrogenase
MRGQAARRRRAAVTGASTGIGQAFSERLARDGWDLCIVARRAGRLEALAKRLRAEHGTKVQVLPADLTDPAALRALEGRLARDARLELLVNDAGMGDFGAFARHDREVVDAEVRLNVLTVVRLTHAALRGMLRRRRGAIVNVSSTMAFQPFPYAAIYGATKAFLNSFTEALHEELRGSGVRVQSLCPGLTHTEIFASAGADVSSLPSFLWMEPEAVVAESLSALERGAVVCVPGLGNRALSSLSRLVPHELSRRVAGVLMQQVKERRPGARPRKPGPRTPAR